MASMQPPADAASPIVPDDAPEEQETQQQTQSTQQASQTAATSVDAHLFGYLQPCSAALNRIDFFKISPVATIGRNPDANMIVLPGLKISNKHCRITWDGPENTARCISVLDLSSNGTFINGQKIGRNQTRQLWEGNEIAFGTSLPQPQDGGIEDYRFVYHHCVGGLPTDGLYAFYDVTQELGKGSFATVMKAMARATGEWFAVKMIHDSKGVGSEGVNERNYAKTTAFAREIAIMEKLQHPNICQLKEVFYEKNGDINLVLELIDGGDLLDYILTRNGLSEPDAKHITYQICQALTHIHSIGVTHRDLKPENVLLTRDCPPKVKVADFGLAKIVDSATMLRTMCGTPSYLAPEVVTQENHEGYDSLVDSWSVGVIVFSMLTNASPFIEDDQQRDIRLRIAERTIDWNTLRNSDVSKDAFDFIEALLRYSPRQRMTLKEALLHPWLASYSPPDPGAPGSGGSALSIGSVPTGDVSMVSNIAEDTSAPDLAAMEGLQLAADPAAPPASAPASQDPAATIPGAYPRTRRDGGAPLQRRSMVIAASQTGEPDAPQLAEPSWEMVAHAEAAAGGTPPPARGAKRVRAELTPLPEEAPAGDAMDASAGAAGAAAGPDADASMAGVASPRKRGRGASPAKAPRTGRGARGRGKGAAPVAAKTRARGRAAPERETSDEEVPARRRSARTAAVAR